jgi:uncharacterized repeat protein (TIGR01451 family)
VPEKGESVDLSNQTRIKKRPRYLRPLALGLVVADLLFSTAPLLAQSSTADLFNEAQTTYKDPNVSDSAFNATSNQVEVTVQSPGQAGIKIDPIQITNANGSPLTTGVGLAAGDSLSYYFKVTNTGTTRNVLRVPPIVSLLNLEQLGPSPYFAQNGGNQIVILYDQNGNGSIDLSVDQDGDGQWDAFAPDGSPSPDRGPEVWIFNNSLSTPDYVNSNGVNWSTATVFIPAQGSFNVAVTAKVPAGLLPGDPMIVFLGRTPGLANLDNDEGIAGQDEQALTTDTDSQQSKLMDVFTVNVVDDGDGVDRPNDSFFTNGQREASDYQLYRFGINPASAATDLGIDLALEAPLSVGQPGSFLMTVDNSALQDVSEFLIGHNISDFLEGTLKLEVVSYRNQTFEEYLSNIEKFKQPDGTYRIAGVNLTPDRVRSDFFSNLVPGQVLDASSVQFTQDPDGTFRVKGFTFVAGQVIQLRVTGTAKSTLTTSTQSVVKVEVKSPVSADGIPSYADIYDPNNVDQLDLAFQSVQVDLGIKISQIGDLQVGSQGIFELTITNNGPGTIQEFLISHDIGSILADPLELVVTSLENLGEQKTFSISDIRFTQDPDGTFRINGLSFGPGQVLKLRVKGIVRPEVANLEKVQINVRVKSPTLPGGVLLFIDTNPDNDEDRIIDPIGRIVGCDGEPFDSYQGFSVGLYHTSGALGTDLGPLVTLPGATAVAQAEVVLGIRNVNPNNDNPFDLGTTDSLEERLRGQYNFFLSPSQIQAGQDYILVVTPPARLNLGTRRVRLVVISSTATDFTYEAFSLDGLPLSLDNPNAMSQIVTVPQASRNFLYLSTPVTPVCEAQSIQINKTADRATGEPGSIVIYRLTIRNLSRTNLNNVVISDRVPPGFEVLEKSVAAQVGDTRLPVTYSHSGRNVTFTLGGALSGSDPPENNPIATIVYAAELTPDALRGDGRNLALVAAEREDSRFQVSDGPAIYQVDVRNGLLSDLGTIIGRVFVDKNFDGQQQQGEPGVPNAVIYMQNGNRIVTDEDGLFSVANVLPGYHTGVLDLTSVPGYTLAPNAYVLEQNSQSRMVHLEPGGLVRMNFAITPVQEELSP